MKRPKPSGIESLYAVKRFYPTELLRERCEELGVEPPTYAMMDNNVCVWRLPSIEVSAGGIAIPQDSQNPHVKGVIMSMGPRARDVLYSNGIEEGHVVVFARFAGWEFSDKTASKNLRQEYVIIKDRDIIGSDDLRVMLSQGKVKYELDSSTNRWCLSRKALNGKKEKILALAASTASPAEAETARQIAAGMK